ETSEGIRTLATKNVEVITIEPSIRQTLLDLLSDPNLSYILMMLGVWGLIFELYNPGLIFPGIVGVISLVLAFYSFNTLPINYAGMALIIFGVILFVLEIKITSHGFLTAGGIASLLIGSLMLFKVESPLEGVSLSIKVVLSTVGLTAAFFVFVIGMGMRAQRLKPKTGIAGFIGEEGEALSELSSDKPGSVRVHGEIWRAVTAGEAISPGTRISVLDVTNLQLKVKAVTK
ncbi:MAG TPA: NfeD family protein, partial [Bacteroidota bacterium]|nr:NfeD family protein [Bacteroidota bacterium]